MRREVLKKVYIVTTGEYSDYHIVAAFSKKEKAEQFLEFIEANKKYVYDRYRIEELVLDKTGDLLERGYRWYEIDMDRNGSVLRVEERGIDAEDYIDIWGNNIRVTVLAKSEKHAIKIVNEKRIMWVALSRWDAPEASTLDALPIVGPISMAIY